MSAAPWRKALQEIDLVAARASAGEEREHAVPTCRPDPTRHPRAPPAVRCTRRVRGA